MGQLATSVFEEAVAMFGVHRAIDIASARMLLDFPFRPVAQFSEWTRGSMRSFLSQVRRDGAMYIHATDPDGNVTCFQSYISLV